MNKKYPHILINKQALLNNITIAKNAHSGKLIIPVKANAYGHDSLLVSQVCQESGLVDYLAVARIGEALELCKANIKLPILTLGVELDSECDILEAIKNDIEVSVSDLENVKTIAKCATEINKVYNIHLKLDTGFSRLGTKPENALAIAKFIADNPHLHLKSMYTHFAASESDTELTRKQLAILKRTASILINENVGADFYHCYNSGALLYGVFDDEKQAEFIATQPELAPITDVDITFGMRPGILTYGYAPNCDGDILGLKPVMTLVSRVIHTNDVPAGTGVCYNHTYHTTKPTRLATITLGYGDGMSRSLSNKLTVTINGKIYKQVGRITMDLIVIEVDKSVNVGDEVFIFGSKEFCHQNADDLAKLQETISYEITTGISHRVPRYLV